MYLLEITVFEVNISLKWMTQQLKLKSGSCIPKRKITVMVNATIHYDAAVSQLMARTLTAWLADMLKSRGRAPCNPESTYLIRIIIANSIIITQAIV